MKNMFGRVVLITGGSKGIGRETAKRFAESHAQVIITGRRREELEKTASEINAQFGKCDFFQGDVTSIPDCRRIVEAVLEKYHRLDVLINNAGMSMRGLFAETDLDLFRKIVDINFLGAVNMTKFALPALIESQGSVLFVSSLSGLKGLPGIAPYGTAKMALTGFSESLRAEIDHHHVHVGIVYVGFTENDEDKTIYSASGEQVPFRREKNDDSQEHVARILYRVVEKRRAVVYLTALGKVTQFVYRIFPKLSGFLLRKYALKSGRYGK